MSISLVSSDIHSPQASDERSPTSIKQEISTLSEKVNALAKMIFRYIIEPIWNAFKYIVKIPLKLIANPYKKLDSKKFFKVCIQSVRKPNHAASTSIDDKSIAPHTATPSSLQNGFRGEKTPHSQDPKSADSGNPTALKPKSSLDRFVENIVNKPTAHDRFVTGRKYRTLDNSMLSPIVPHTLSFRTPDPKVNSSGQRKSSTRPRANTQTPLSSVVQNKDLPPILSSITARNIISLELSAHKSVPKKGGINPSLDTSRPIGDGPKDSPRR